MTFLFKNGRLITHDKHEPYLEHGAVAVSDDLIVAVGDEKRLSEEYPQAEVIDAGGGIIMPGLVNLHSNMTAVFSVGLPESGSRQAVSDNDPGKRLSSRMTLNQLRNAALAAALECIRNGVTSVFGYNGSSLCISGSLQTIASAFREMGVRACLCCEVDENAPWRQQQAAIDENIEFGAYCDSINNSRIKPAFGIRISDGSNGDNLSRYREMCGNKMGFRLFIKNTEYNTCNSLRKYHRTPVERAIEAGITGENTVAVLSRLDAEEFAMLNSTGTRVVPLFGEESVRSSRNMRYASELGLSAADGRFDMLEAARTAESELKRIEPYLYSPGTAKEMLFKANAETASRFFGIPIGTIAPGAQADIIVIDYDNFTPIEADNAEKHIIMNCSGGQCRTVMASGKLLMHDGELLGFSGKEIKLMALDSAEKLWAALH